MRRGFLREEHRVLADDNDKTPRDAGGRTDLPNLADFAARLQKTRKMHIEPAVAANRGTAIGIAFRLSTELVAGLVVGGGMGWLLDKWLGTSPWLLLIFFFLGVAAGILNVFRTAQQIAAETERSNGGSGQS